MPIKASVSGLPPLGTAGPQTLEALSEFWRLSSDLLAVFDGDGCFEQVSPAWEQLLGWRMEEMIGRSWEDFIHPDDHERTLAIGVELGEDGVLRDFANRYLTKDGGARWLLWNAQLVPTADGATYFVARDITDLQQDRQRLSSARDHLRAVTDSMADGMFTLDHEGRLTYLNASGARMLGWSDAELASLPLHDTLHRTRGHDARPCEHGCSLASIAARAGEVRDEDDTFTCRDGSLLPVAFTASPFTTEAGVDGFVVVFHDITERKVSELRLRQEVEAMGWLARVREALAEDRLVLYAQPIIDLASGEVVSHELLLRMIEGDEVITPGHFLPVAEEYGLMGEVDRWVISRAVELAATGREVEFNVSASSVGKPEILEHFEHELRVTGADPCRLVVEITETAVLEDERAGVAFARRLNELGCRLALDDFGTGYGGFTYLTRLPVDMLKIDTEFVRNLPFNPGGRHVVEAVINLASGFGQKTVAEGVEDQLTLQILRRLGVHYAQGFAIGMPAPIAEPVAA